MHKHSSPSQATRRPRGAVVAPTLLTAITLLAACGGRTGTTVSRPTDFVRTVDAGSRPATSKTTETGNAAASETGPRPVTNADPRRSRRRIEVLAPPPAVTTGATTSIEPDSGTAEVEVLTGVAPTPVVGVREVGSLFLIDGKVGEINGRSVLAQEFLEDFNLVGILRQESIRLITETGSASTARRAWRQIAAAEIGRALDELIEDEIVYRERLTQVEGGGAGIRRVLNNVREILRRQSYGSLVSAEAWVKSQGRAESVEQFADDLNRDQIIRFELNERVKQRIAVSWREVENYYRRNLDTYAPPPRATIRLIQCAAEDIQELQARLDAGDAFAEVAESSSNRFRRRDGGLYRGGDIEFTPPFEEYQFIAQPAVNEALTKLEPDEWAGPITVDSSAYFVFLESLTDEARTLYEAQLEIEGAIRTRKTQRETDRYITSLLEASSITRREVMARRLAEYAERALFDPIAGEG